MDLENDHLPSTNSREKMIALDPKYSWRILVAVSTILAASAAYYGQYWEIAEYLTRAMFLTVTAIVGYTLAYISTKPIREREGNKLFSTKNRNGVFLLVSFLWLAQIFPMSIEATGIIWFIGIISASLIVGVFLGVERVNIANGSVEKAEELSARSNTFLIVMTAVFVVSDFASGGYEAVNKAQLVLLPILAFSKFVYNWRIKNGIRVDEYYLRESQKASVSAMLSVFFLFGLAYVFKDSKFFPVTWVPFVEGGLVAILAQGLLSQIIHVFRFRNK